MAPFSNFHGKNGNMKHIPVYVIMAACFLTGCFKNPPPPLPQPEAKAPVAEVNAVAESSEARPQLTLDGRASYDPGNLPLRFRWQIVDGPANARIADTAASLTNFSKYTPGNYRIVLTVTNSAGKSAADTAMISILKNHPPVANAGEDQTVYWPEELAELDGSQTYDRHDDIISFRWRKISGPSLFKLEDSTRSRTQVYLQENGSYRFELTALDAMGAAGRDTVEIARQGPVYGNGEVVLFNLPLICPWGCNITVSNYKSLLNAGSTLKKVFVRKTGTNAWTEASSNLENSPSYEIAEGKDLLVWIWDENQFGYQLDVKLVF